MPEYTAPPSVSKEWCSSLNMAGESATVDSSKTEEHHLFTPKNKHPLCFTVTEGSSRKIYIFGRTMTYLLRLSLQLSTCDVLLQMKEVITKCNTALLEKSFKSFKQMQIKNIHFLSEINQIHLFPVHFSIKLLTSQSFFLLPGIRPKTSI